MFRRVQIAAKGISLRGQSSCFVPGNKAIRCGLSRHTSAAHCHVALQPPTELRNSQPINLNTYYRPLSSGRVVLTET